MSYAQPTQALKVSIAALSIGVGILLFVALRTD
jgi:hypothetical protein